MLVLCGGAAALAVGMPPLVMPAPMLAASGLVLFYESQVGGHLQSDAVPLCSQAAVTL